MICLIFLGNPFHPFHPFFPTANHRRSVDHSINKEAPRANSAPPPPTSEVGTPCAGATVPDGESLPEQTATGAPGGKVLEDPAAAGGTPIKAGLAAVEGQTQLRVYDDGLDSMPGTDNRRNEFHTLQDEMHQKRAVGMRWGVCRECCIQFFLRVKGVATNVNNYKTTSSVGHALISRGVKEAGGAIGSICSRTSAPFDR